MKIGPMELIVVFIVALLVIGPNKLPEYAKKLGGALKEFRKASESITKEIKEEVIEPLEEAQRPLREAIEPLTEVTDQINNDFKEVKSSITGIGKPKKKTKGEKTDDAEVPSEGAKEKPKAEESAAPAAESAPAEPAAPAPAVESAPAPAETPAEDK